MTRWLGIMAAALLLVGTACSETTSEIPNAGSVGIVSSTAASTSTSTTATPTTETTQIPSSTTLAPRHPVPSGEPAWIVSVTDGDTVVVTVQGIKERVRLIGINTPESGECMADEATEALEQLVAGREVILSVDVNDRDKYGRLLRYIWVDDVFVNEQMVETGLALARRYEPDTSLADLLDAAQDRAKAAGLGMWAPDACGARSVADVVIAEIQYDAPGNDNDNQNGEWVKIENRGTNTVDLTGWILKDESASHRYAFATGFHLDAGSAVTVYTGCGNDSASELYWCEQGSAVWNNSGDTGFLLDPSGNIVQEYQY